MYLTHYYFTLIPFEESPDPRFFWLSEKHKEALANLKYGIQENKAFLLLNGDIGAGKTSLIHYLLLDNEIDTIAATIPDPDLSILDFFKLISKQFNMNIDFNTKGGFLNQFEPLTEQETQEYIKYRLGVAGSETEIFNSEAVYEVFSFSRGYPRLINIICDRALLTGYISETEKITGTIVSIP